MGSIRFSEIPPLKAPHQECNLFALANAGRVDLSIAEWTPPGEFDEHIAPKPKIDAIRTTAKMSDYQPVRLVGKESGLVKAQLSGVTMWKVIDFMDFGGGPAGARCFGTLFEITDVAGDRANLVHAGDSGAWIFDRVGELCLLNGMLIARQGRRAYGCYAEFMLNAMEQCPECPGGLSVQW